MLNETPSGIFHFQGQVLYLEVKIHPPQPINIFHKKKSGNHHPKTCISCTNRLNCMRLRSTCNLEKDMEKSACGDKENTLAEMRIQVVNKLGLHARPAALLVQVASRFKSEIRLKKDEMEVNAKSILSVMMLAAEVGSFILLKAEGADEQQALEAIARLFEDKFGEE